MDICKNEGWNYSCLNFFSVFSCTFRIYNKHEKTKVFIFEEVRSLEEVVFGFLGETLDV